MISGRRHLGVLLAGALVLCSGALARAEEPQPSSEEKPRAQLEGTRWAVDLTPLAEAGENSVHHDVLAFTKAAVSSEWLSQMGYAETAYRLAPSEGSTVVWDAMYAKTGDGVVFWKGEFSGSTVRGLMSRHPVQGKVEDFAFSGKESVGTAIEAAAGAPSSERVESAPMTEPPAEVEPAVTEPPKKKKHRFGIF